MTKYINPFQAEYDTNGEPLVGGKLNFYDAGTTDRQPVYSDEALTTPLSNPVIANGDGRFPTMYMQKIKYKIVLTDIDDVVVQTVDDYDFTNETLFNDIKVYATTTVSGVVILATASDVIEGTSDTKVVTPASITDTLNALEIIPKGYINGGILTYNTTKIIDISDCLAKSSDESEKLDIIGNSLTIDTDADWASGTAPSLTDASIFVWADDNSGSQRFIFDNATGTNIAGAKRRVGAFITDNSDNIIPITNIETDGGGILTSYGSDEIEEIFSIGAVSISVPNGIEIQPILFLSALEGNSQSAINAKVDDIQVLFTSVGTGSTEKIVVNNTIYHITVDDATITTSGNWGTGDIITQGFIDGRTA